MESRKGDAAQYWQAVAEGALALPPAAAPSSSAGASPGQAAEVALLCLERLASLVAHNAAVGGRDLAVQLAPVAGLLERLVRLEHEGSQQSGPGRLRVLLFHRVSPPCVVVLCFTPPPAERAAVVQCRLPRACTCAGGWVGVAFCGLAGVVQQPLLWVFPGLSTPAHALLTSLFGLSHSLALPGLPWPH